MFGYGNYFWPNSRESVGVRFVDYAQSKLNARWQRLHSAKSDVAMANNVAFVKPLTYLASDNWRALAGITQLFDVPAQRIVLVYPDVRLEVGHHMLYAAGSQSVADRSPLLHQFFLAVPNSSFSYLAFGIGAPSLRTDLLLSASYETDDARLERAYLTNRLPRDQDPALLAAFDKALDQLRFDDADQVGAASVAATSAAVSHRSAEA